MGVGAVGVLVVGMVVDEEVVAVVAVVVAVNN